MKYKFRTHKIEELIKWIDQEAIDLKPYYQRNDIWTKNDQQSLIDTILKGYPLPNFFIYQRENNKSEMVDGQQRARTIHRFYKKGITSSKKQTIDDISLRIFLDYELYFTELYDVTNKTEIEEFYVLVNKKGKHLTTPEIHKAEFANTNFLSLVEELLQLQYFINLDLFSEASARRMSDRNFVEELIAYLIFGIQDKKSIIEDIYKKDISENQAKELNALFTKIIKKINCLNEIYTISSTRYKQKNDFYTLFNFVHENIKESNEILQKQYEVLLLIDPHISPSLEDCDPLREYALNCVSQSNSKKAREARLKFFRSILLNKEKDISKNEILAEIADFFDRHKYFKIDFIEVSDLVLIHKR